VTDPSRPDNVFDEGLQHERTALAWERTAVATMVAGVVLARFAAVESFWIAAVIGLAQTAFGGVLLVWSGTHYDDLHEPLRKGDDVVHPVATRVVGVATVAGSAVGALVAVGVVLR
jgi:putative membrane protein